MECCGQCGVSGSHLLVTGFLEREQCFVLRHPAWKNEGVALSPADLDYARGAYGTDDAVIVIDVSTVPSPPSSGSNVSSGEGGISGTRGRSVTRQDERLAGGVREDAAFQPHQVDEVRPFAAAAAAAALQGPKEAQADEASTHVVADGTGSAAASGDGGDGGGGCAGIGAGNDDYGGAADGRALVWPLSNTSSPALEEALAQLGIGAECVIRSKSARLIPLAPTWGSG